MSRSAGARASAPGKVMLTGEYAVLAGGQAIVAAVDRRAIARFRADDEAPAAPPSPFLVAVAEVLAAVRGPDSIAAGAAARIVVDSQALADPGAGAKLGLGSSAAATVAAVALALSVDPNCPGPDDDDDAWLPLVWQLARAAHAAAQGARGARGSGADIAAATFGGVVSVRGDDVRPVRLPTDLALRAVWTGQPADTATLVAAVQALGARSPAAYRAHTDALAAASDALLIAASATAALAALTASADAFHALATQVARAGGPALEPPCVATLRALAERHDGTAKTTGAGGGDLVLLAVPALSAAALDRALQAAGTPPLILTFAPPGATLDP